MMGRMLLYPEDTAAGLMTLDVASFLDYQTVADTIAEISDRTARSPDISRVYVVGADNSFVGSLSLPELMFAPPYAMLREALDGESVAVRWDDSYENCARIMAGHDQARLPVIDDQGVLIGAIATEDMGRVAEMRAAQDVVKLFGLGGEDQVLGPFWNSVRSRFPWLLINLMTVLMAGFIVSLFESTIEGAAMLAIFIPVVVGQAGIAGTQTVTMVVRAIALQEVDERDSRALLMKEGALAVLQGTSIALILMLLVWVWQDSFILGLVVGSSMLINLMVAALGGVAVPLAMKTLRIDPAASSAVVVTTMTEMIGIVAYLGLAAWLISMNTGA
jgi:magnesium transporter